MLIQVLKSKINATVTGAEKDYEGSLTLCPSLMFAANLHSYERVEVNARDHDARIITYIIPGNSGQVELNGGAANFFAVGDKIHINCFSFVGTPKYQKTFWGGLLEPQIVNTDDKNKIRK